MKSNIECMIFLIIPKAGYCCKLTTLHCLIVDISGIFSWVGAVTLAEELTPSLYK